MNKYEVCVYALDQDDEYCLVSELEFDTLREAREYAAKVYELDFYAGCRGLYSKVQEV